MRADVALVFAGAPAAISPKIARLRDLIFATAAATDGVGPLSEELRWGEPAYLTAATGSTIRIGWKADRTDRFALHFNCKTTLVGSFRTLFSEELAFDGNRSILFDEADELPETVLAMCIAMALTYHRKPRRSLAGGVAPLGPATP